LLLPLKYLFTVSAICGCTAPGPTAGHGPHTQVTSLARLNDFSMVLTARCRTWRGHSAEGCGMPATLEIPTVLCKPKAHYRAHNSPPCACSSIQHAYSSIQHTCSSIHEQMHKIHNQKLVKICICKRKTRKPLPFTLPKLMPAVTQTRVCHV
jgi:hypothetical protein